MPCVTGSRGEEEDGLQKPGTPRKQPIGTPFSQASTAPPTPAFMSLKHPMESSDEDEAACRFERLSSGSSDIELELPMLPIYTPDELQEEARICIGMPPLQSELGKWVQWQCQWEEANSNADGVFVSDGETGSECFAEDEGDCTVEQIQQIFTKAELQEEPHVCIGMPPLQSELGKWAQWQVQWELANGNDGYLESDDETNAQDDLVDEPHMSFGMTPLQSGLAKWAQCQVECEAAHGNDPFFDSNAE